MGEKGGDKLDPKIVKKTQDTLGKIVKKPPMTEKLLAKPPFRFLHDIMTSIIKSHGFMKGLYTNAESQSDNVKEKDAKVAFLQKAIDIVSLVTGKTVAAKPTKVVAGQEADKTNEFLQMLAEAVNKKVDNDEYVQRVLKGDTGGGGKPPAGDKKDRKERDKDKDKKKDEKKSHRDEDKEKRHRSKDRDDKRDRKDRDKAKGERERSKDRDVSREKSGDRRHRDRDRGGEREKEKKEDSSDRHKDRERRKHREKDRESEEKPKEEPQENGEAEGEGAEESKARRPRPNSAKGSRRRQGRRHDSDNEDEGEAKEADRSRGRRSEPQSNGTIGEDDLPPQVAAARKMARPSSARPAPPKVKKNDVAPEPAMIVGSGNVPNVITDKDSSDDEDIFVKDDEPPEPEPEPQRQQEEDDEGAEHGGLVKKMLEKKKELEGGSQIAQAPKKTEIERSHVNDAQRRKERDMIQKDIDRLRGSIQTLTRSVNPLGKIMDFLQEDLDSMQKELEMWKKENKGNAVALQREQSITESSIEPLKAQLVELDQAIADQLDLIAAVKCNIIRDDDRVDKMMSTLTKS